MTRYGTERKYLTNKNGKVKKRTNKINKNKLQNYIGWCIGNAACGSNVGGRLNCFASVT